jgi:hypothetical protein
MGSGGSRGLQNRCFGAEASKGWFDSDAPPPMRLRGLAVARSRGVCWNEQRLQGNTAIPRNRETA